jgi:splicing factor 3B subunit 2
MLQPGKPPVDAYGRPLYGGNPFDPPGSGKQDNDLKTGLVTSDGKTIGKSPWGMPAGAFVGLGEAHSDGEESSSEEESSGDDMDESDAEEEGVTDGIESVLPPPPTATATAPGDLRKQPAGDETPLVDTKPKQLYQVLETTKATDQQQGGVFESEVKYVVPGATAAAVPEGAESVLSKAMPPSETAKRKRKHDDDDEGDLGKNFKF